MGCILKSVGPTATTYTVIDTIAANARSPEIQEQLLSMPLKDFLQAVLKYVFSLMAIGPAETPMGVALRIHGDIDPARGIEEPLPGMCSGWGSGGGQ